MFSSLVQNPPHTISVAIPVYDELNKCSLKTLTGTGCRRLAPRSWGWETARTGTWKDKGKEGRKPSGTLAVGLPLQQTCSREPHPPSLRSRTLPSQVLGQLTAQACQETWHFPCPWMIDCAFQFFPVHLTVLSGKTKQVPFFSLNLFKGFLKIMMVTIQ